MISCNKYYIIRCIIYLREKKKGEGIGVGEESVECVFERERERERGRSRNAENRYGENVCVCYIAK